MLLQYTGQEIGCVAGHKAFKPGEKREVLFDEGIELLKSHLFSEVKPAKKVEKEDSKPLSKSAK